MGYFEYKKQNYAKEFGGYETKMYLCIVFKRNG